MSSGRDPESILFDLARSVADGRPVDWDAESSAGEASYERIRRLRILESIATACGMPPEDAPAQAEASWRWGHLEIRAKIGEGVFGEVYRAWEATLAREVALKLLRPAPGEEPGADAVVLEARNLARVRHAGVVSVYGAEKRDGRVGIWMELVRGQTLEDLLQRQGPFGAQEALTIGIALCRALAAVHGAGLVHRDIKTRNVVREEGGRIVLMDFGAGTELEPGRAGARSLTGTPFYLAPEILRGEAATPRSDLYSLGVLLYRLVTRGYPFAAGSLDELRRKHAAGERTLLQDVRPDLPAAFVRAVDRAIAPSPQDRYATAGQMENALAAAGAGPSRPRGRLARLAGLACLALGVALAVQRFVPRRPSTPAARSVVVVADFVNETGESDLDGLSSMLITSLEQSRSLSVITRSRMRDVLEMMGKEDAARVDETLGLELCRQARAAALLVPSIRKFGDLYTIDLAALDPQRSEHLFTARQQGTGRERIPGMIDALSEGTRLHFREEGSAIRASSRPVEQIVTANLDAYGHYDTGERHIDALRMDAARASLLRAVALDSTFGLAYCRLAYVCWWQSDFAGESRMLDRAAALVDRIPERERYRLRAHRAMADRLGLEAARSILLEMEHFYPDDKRMLYDIGDLSSHLCEYPLAVEYLDRVVEIDPEFVRAHQHLARTYRELGRRAACLDAARRFAAVDSSWESSVLLGEALVASGETAAGMAMLARAREVYPQRLLETTDAIARAHAFLGDESRAAAEWRALADGPQLAWVRRFALRQLAFQEARRGRVRAAEADLARCLELAREDGDESAEALARADLAYLLLLGRGDPEPARAEIERCSDLEGTITYKDRYFDYWPYWGRVFKLQLRLGHVAQAEALAKRKFASDKWYGPYVEAYLHGAKGECAAAAAAAAGVLEWGPASESVELLYFLSQCWAKQGELPSAGESLDRLGAMRSNLLAETPLWSAGLLLQGEVQERLDAPARALAACEALAVAWAQADPELPDRLELERRLARLRAARGGR